jgi:Protein of unknown function (DUF1444)
MQISSSCMVRATLPLLSVLVQSCSAQFPLAKSQPPAKPLFVIKVERDKHFAPSAASAVSLDKLFADEIEQPSLDRDRFDQLLADALIKTEPGQSIVGIKDHAITIKYPDGGTADTYTENAWAICKDIPGERKSHLRTFLFSTKEMRKGFDKNKDTLSDVVPLVRGDAMLEATKNLKMQEGNQSAKSLDLAWYRIAPGIICVYAADSPNSLAMLPATKATELGLTAADIKKQPLRTLLSHLPIDINVYGTNGIYLPTCGGDFESSLILDDQFMQTIKKRVKGRLIFGVSNKEVLILSGDADKDVVDRVRQMTEHNWRQLSRPISDKLYYWDDGQISLCP